MKLLVELLSAIGVGVPVTAANSWRPRAHEHSVQLALCIFSSSCVLLLFLCLSFCHLRFPPLTASEQTSVCLQIPAGCSQCFKRDCLIASLLRSGRARKLHLWPFWSQSPRGLQKACWQMCRPRRLLHEAWRYAKVGRSNIVTPCSLSSIYQHVVPVPVSPGYVKHT